MRSLFDSVGPKSQESSSAPAAYHQTIINPDIASNVTSKMFQSLGRLYNFTTLRLTCDWASLSLLTMSKARPQVLKAGPREIEVSGDADTVRTFLTDNVAIHAGMPGSCQLNLTSIESAYGSSSSELRPFYTQKYVNLNLELIQERDATKISCNVNHGEELQLQTTPDCVTFQATHSSRLILDRNQTDSSGYFRDFLDASNCAESPNHIEVAWRVKNLATGNHDSGAHVLFLPTKSHEQEFAHALYGFTGSLTAIMLLFLCKRKKIMANCVPGAPGDEREDIPDENMYMRRLACMLIGFIAIICLGRATFSEQSNFTLKL